jgi:nicotinate-nucleotide pyrophosphorylase
MNAWSMTHDAERLSTLAQSLSTDSTYQDPTTPNTLQGVAAISAHIGATQQMIPGVQLQIDTYQQLGDVSLASWIMKDGDHNALSTGHSFARYNDEGQIVETIGFFPLPE